STAGPIASPRFQARAANARLPRPREGPAPWAFDRTALCKPLTGPPAQESMHWQRFRKPFPSERRPVGLRPAPEPPAGQSAADPPCRANQGFPASARRIISGPGSRLSWNGSTLVYWKKAVAPSKRSRREEPRTYVSSCTRPLITCTALYLL